MTLHRVALPDTCLGLIEESRVAGDTHRKEIRR